MASNINRSFLGDVPIWGRVSIWELFILPVNLAVCKTLWDSSNQSENPVWAHYINIMPMSWWAVGGMAVCGLLVAAFALDSLWLIRGVYALFMAFWAWTTYVIWREVPGAFLLTLCIGLAYGCMLRQALLWWLNRGAP